MRLEGLVDLQVNGFAGVDFNAATLTADALDHALAAMRDTGVSTCLPTLITATAQDLAERLAALDEAIRSSRLGPAMCPGYHLEGPFLNPAPGTRGCHDPAAMTAPDAGLLEGLARDLARPILLVTLAPELPGSTDFIRAMRAKGRLVAIGHAAPSPEEVAAAAEAGATLSTHLGNASPAEVHKFRNPIMAQLAEDRLSACFIADGIHVPPFALKAMIRAKGVSRSILVTDAVAAAAAPPGLYRLAGMAVERKADGSVTLPGTDRLAGSALTLDAACRNVVAWELASPEEALAMARDNPARIVAQALRDSR